MPKMKPAEKSRHRLSLKYRTRREFLKNMVALSFGIICATFTEASWGATKETNMLVIYFSHTGNTRDVAKEIQTLTGSQIVEIKPVTPFPTDYATLVTLAEKQAADNFRPSFTVDLPDDLNKYGIIFLGFPIWAYTMPMIVYSFLEKYHFADKKIAPFCTNEGSGLADSQEQISKLCPDADVLPGLAVRGSQAAYSAGEVKNWLGRLGIIK